MVHAYHAKRRWMSPSATPATQSTAASLATKRAQARHQSQPSAISATPATKVDVTKCHACDAKRRSMSPSPTPATQSTAVGCRQVLRLPRKDGVPTWEKMGPTQPNVEPYIHSAMCPKSAQHGAKTRRTEANCATCSANQFGKIWS